MRWGRRKEGRREKKAPIKPITERLGNSVKQAMKTKVRNVDC